MNNNDYLEKLLGEQYDMKNYFVDTYAEPQVNVIQTMNQDAQKSTVKTEIEKKEEKKEEKNEQSVNSDNEPVNVNNEKYEYQQNTKTEPNKTQNQDIIEEYVPRQYQAIQVSTDLSDLYPGIYKAIDPIVELAVSNMGNNEINEETIESMSTRIYNAIKPGTMPENNENEIPVNGRPHNNLLHDLIKILLLNKLKPIPPHNYRPPMPSPPMPRNYNNRRVSNNINYQDLPYPEDDV